MEHYYFKYGTSNELFEEHLRKNNSSEIELEIFFENWRAEDYPNHYLLINDSRNRKQINYFMESESKNTCFWIFHQDDIYIYKPIEKAKSPNELPARENYKIIPKIRKSKLLKTLKKEDCPEILSTLSANQAYNRKTIEKFTGNIKQIADSILLGEKLKIKTEDRLNYLSPVQFETLIFLIFHHTDIYVSTHRGGTKKRIDLQLRVTEQNNLGLNDHQYYNIQIKMYDYLKNNPNFSFEENNYLIHTGKTDQNKNILGKDWIEDRIAKIDKVNRWLDFTLEHFEII